jgi:hypothetical protein
MIFNYTRAQGTTKLFVGKKIATATSVLQKGHCIIHSMGKKYADTTFANERMQVAILVEVFS